MRASAYTTRNTTSVISSTPRKDTNIVIVDLLRDFVVAALPERRLGPESRRFLFFQLMFFDH
jgi:hypothetical protein